MEKIKSIIGKYFILLLIMFISGCTNHDEYQYSSIDDIPENILEIIIDRLGDNITEKHILTEYLHNKNYYDNLIK